jgi:hypothetical protein
MTEISDEQAVVRPPAATGGANAIELPDLVMQTFSTTTSVPIDRWVCDTACDDYMIASPEYFVPGTTRKCMRTIRMAMTSREVEITVGDVEMVLEAG